MMHAKANLFRTLLVLPVVVLVAVAVALFGLGLRTAETQTTPASTTTYYKVQEDLGTLGGSSSYASAINDSGQVVGYSYPANGLPHAFLYEDGEMKDLGTLGGTSSYAYDINNSDDINRSGQVVGWSENSSGEGRPFIYDSTNGMQDLNTLIPADSGLIEQATAINTDGKIAVLGYSFGDYYSGSFLLTPASTATSATYEVQGLPTLPNGYSIIRAMGINDPGQVVGKAWYDCYGCGDSHAFLYNESATPKIQDLGGYFSEATGINDAGQVVGRSSWRAFIYDSTNGMKDLGTLGGGYSEAKAINRSGRVVGRSDNSSGDRRAFIYDSTNGMQDLNTLIPPDSGWTIEEATAINTEGKIAATGYKARGGKHALLLTPTSDIPPPAITSPKHNTYDSDGFIIFSGSAAAGSTVELIEGDTSKGTTTANSSTGAWSITLREVSEGAHTYSARVKDAEGNTSPASNTVTVTVDTTPPTVNSVTPSDRATGVSLSTTPVTATFSEDMDPDTLNDTDTQTGSDKSFTLKQTKQGATTAIPVTVSYDAATKMATLTPSSSLAANTKYTATVKGGASGAKDKAGNALASDKVWSFTTKK